MRKRFSGPQVVGERGRRRGERDCLQVVRCGGEGEGNRRVLMTHTSFTSLHTDTHVDSAVLEYSQ